jgi:cytochrome oxidase assembly protein ShyY1
MKLRVELDWRTTLATALLLPTLLSLGFWQLDRADEKAVLIERLEARRTLPAITPQSAIRLPQDELADRQVVMDAHFSPSRYVLRDNRLRGGKFGYEVVAFAEVDQLAVALNLGWIQGDPARQALPNINLPVGLHTVSGRIYQPSGDAFMLGENPLPAQLPGVVQQLTLSTWRDELRVRLDQSIFPLEIRADEFEVVAFDATWAIVNQTPAKHQGYAVQWFTMAVALGLAFIFRSTNLWHWLRNRIGRP